MMEEPLAVEYVSDTEDLGPLYERMFPYYGPRDSSPDDSSAFVTLSPGGLGGSFSSKLNGLGEDEDTTRKWNDEYQNLLSEGKHVEAHAMYHEFQEAAVKFARGVIEARLSGGTKAGYYQPMTRDPPTYTSKGLYLVIATGDKTRAFYGCTENVAKILSNEMKALRFFFRDIVLHQSEGKHRKMELCLPLSILVRHVGYTVLVSAVTPTDKAARIAGISSDRPNEFLVPSLGTNLSNLFGQITRRLNVAGRFLSNYHDERQSYAAAVSFSITTGWYAAMSDHLLRVYIMEIGRSFGSTDVSQAVGIHSLCSGKDISAMGMGGGADRYGARFQRAHHYQRFRPEAVLQSKEPVPSDGFLNNEYKTTPELVELTRNLLGPRMVKLAKELVSLPVDILMSLDGGELTNMVHAAGVNMRYLGLLLQHVMDAFMNGEKIQTTLPPIHQKRTMVHTTTIMDERALLPHQKHLLATLRIEIIARSVKSLLFDKFRTIGILQSEEGVQLQHQPAAPTRLNRDETRRDFKYRPLSPSASKIPGLSTGRKLAHYLKVVATLSGQKEDVAGSDTQRYDTILTPRPPSGYCRDNDACAQKHALDKSSDDPYWNHKVVVAALLEKVIGHGIVEDKYWIQSIHPEILLKFRCADHEVRRVPKQILLQRCCAVCGVTCAVNDFSDSSLPVISPKDVEVFTTTKGTWTTNSAMIYNTHPRRQQGKKSEFNLTGTLSLSSGQTDLVHEQITRSKLMSSEDFEKQYLSEIASASSPQSELYRTALRKLIELYTMWGASRASQLAICKQMQRYSKRLDFEARITKVWEAHNLDGIVTGKCSHCGVVMNLSNGAYHNSSTECDLKRNDPSSTQLLLGAYPAGLEDIIIPNGSFSASSSLEGCAPYQGRLNLPCTNHWRPARVDNMQWLQVDLGEIRTVKALSTQGSPMLKAHTKHYRLFYSNNGKKWTQYCGAYIHHDVTKGETCHVRPDDPTAAVVSQKVGKVSNGILMGNPGPTGTVRNTFYVPFSARYVRVNPFHTDFKNCDISLALEIYVQSNMDLTPVVASNTERRDRVPLCEVDWNSLVDNRSNITRWSCGKQEAVLWKSIDAVEEDYSVEHSSRVDVLIPIVRELLRLYTELISLYEKWGTEREGDLVVVRKRFIDVMVRNVLLMKDTVPGRLQALELARRLPAMVFKLGPEIGNHSDVILTVEGLLVKLNRTDILLEFYTAAVTFYGRRNPVIIFMLSRLTKILMETGKREECLKLYKTVLDPAFMEYVRASGYVPSVTPRHLPQLSSSSERIPTIRNRVATLVLEDEYNLFSPYHPHPKSVRAVLHGPSFQALAGLHQSLDSTLNGHTLCDMRAPYDLTFINELHPVDEQELYPVESGEEETERNNKEHQPDSLGDLPLS